MITTFPRIRFALMVGIGGGVPNTSNDIRLGDVVVSKPVGKHSGVIQYDYGKAVQDGQFELTGMLNKPPHTLLMHIARLEARQMPRRENAISTIVRDILEQSPGMKDKFSPPDQQKDYLFHSYYHHTDKESNCEKCDKEYLVNRQLRHTRTPYIHYGLIASGDQVMKDSETRDRLAQQHGILCFEMEAAGLMDEIPTLVIRGICDYCDSHKQKEWQGYAALTAAAYAKLLLSAVPVSRADVASMKNNRVYHWMVPLARNPRFVGRQNEIANVEKLITMQDGPRKVAITGLGGVGKTQVALELAYRMRDQDKHCSIFWLPCTSLEMIEQTYLNMAQILELQEVKPAEVKEQIKRYLSSKHAGKWLLIIDNADDTDMWLSASDIAPALENFLPQSEQGRILFTTRNRKLGVELTSSNIIHIPDADEEIAFEILEKSLAQKDLLKDHITNAALLDQLTFLPLAITQASAYINKNGLSLSTYLTLLQEYETEVVDLLSEDFKDQGRYRDIQNPVITTWLISFKQIQHQDQLAADYLSFMACINPRNIPQSLLPLPTSKKHGIDALGLLNAYSFINGQGEYISIHRLVHIATRNWLRKNALFSHWIQRVADQIHKVFPDDHYSNRELWREYLPHALSLVCENAFIIQQEQYTNLIEKIADCLLSDGRYQEAERLYSDLIRIKQEKNRLEDPSTLSSIANLASTFWNQGRWNEAEKLDMQVMETSKTVLGAEHPSTLSSMANLAATYRNQGRWNEAEKLEVQVMETRKTLLGAEHPDTLTSMGNLAYTWKSQGKLQDALPLMENCSDLRNKVLGPNHPDARSSSNALSNWRDIHNSSPHESTPAVLPQIEHSQHRRKFQRGIQQLWRSLSRPVVSTSNHLTSRDDQL